jgi:hypothetical protein
LRNFSHKVPFKDSFQVENGKGLYM